VLPWLLAIGGLLGMFWFGVLALLVGVQNRLIGLVVLTTVAYITAQIIRSFWRA